ncbi:MAG: hypothetical protein ABSA13_18060 [Beijerinckiaceae bacterium]
MSEPFYLASPIMCCPAGLDPYQARIELREKGKDFLATQGATNNGFPVRPNPEDRPHGAIGNKPPAALMIHDGAASPPS